MEQSLGTDLDTLRIERDRLVRLREALPSNESARHQVSIAVDALDKAIDGCLRESTRPTQSTSRYRRPVRAFILDALEDFGWPTFSRELSLYCEARYGKRIPLTRFGALSHDEMTSYEKKAGRDTVWLCFCLTSVRGESIRRLWARSDWPLEQRIMAPTTGRVQHLRLTLRLCEIALEADNSAAHPEMLRIIAADHARDLPGVKGFRRGEFPLQYWRDLAFDLIQKSPPQDEDLRREAAKKFCRLPEKQQLFGALEEVDTTPVLVSGRARR